jgi:hypothetical protein
MCRERASSGHQALKQLDRHRITGRGCWGPFEVKIEN